MTALSQRRAAALAEVLGVFLMGGLLTDLLVRFSGIPVTNPLATLNVHITDAQLITASLHMFVLLMFVYAGYFLLIIPLNWWHRRRGPAAYGLTTAGSPWTMLILAGLGTAALSEWPVLSVGLLNSLFPSQTAPWRQAFFAMSWYRWQFWLFSAVTSWALIPFLEELFFRGYCQRRLAEDWGTGPAIIGAACLFTCEHTQYQFLNAYNVGMVFGLFISAIGFGVVFAWTRSLIPGIIAHAIFDVPMTPMWESTLVAMLLIGAWFSWPKGLAAVRQVFSTESRVAYGTLAILGTVWTVVGARVRSLQYVALALVVVAIVLEALEGRRKRTVSEASISG